MPYPVPKFNVTSELNNTEKCTRRGGKPNTPSKVFGEIWKLIQSVQNMMKSVRSKFHSFSGSRKSIINQVEPDNRQAENTGDSQEYFFRLEAQSLQSLKTEDID